MGCRREAGLTVTSNRHGYGQSVQAEAVPPFYAAAVPTFFSMQFLPCRVSWQIPASLKPKLDQMANWNPPPKFRALARSLYVVTGAEIC